MTQQTKIELGTCYIHTKHRKGHCVLLTADIVYLYCSVLLLTSLMCTLFMWPLRSACCEIWSQALATQRLYLQQSRWMKDHLSYIGRLSLWLAIQIERIPMPSHRKQSKNTESGVAMTWRHPELNRSMIPDAAWIVSSNASCCVQPSGWASLHMWPERFLSQLNRHKKRSSHPLT